MTAKRALLILWVIANGSNVGAEVPNPPDRFSYSDYMSSYYQGGAPQTMRRQPLIFRDQATGHSFSDTLVADLVTIPHGVGLRRDPLGLPDQKEEVLIQSDDAGARSLEIARLGELLRGSITEFGELFRALVRGRALIDLGCGIPSESFVPRLVAQMLGAKRYLGIDNGPVSGPPGVRYLKPEVRRGEFRATGGDPDFAAVFVPEEMSIAMANLRDPLPKVVYWAGLEQYGRDPRAREQFQNSVEQVIGAVRARTKTGDAVVIGPPIASARAESAVGSQRTIVDRHLRKAAFRPARRLSGPYRHQIYLKQRD